MNGLKKIPFFLLLLVLFFCLHGTVENFGFIDAREVAITGLVILAAVAVLFFILFLFTRNYASAALTVFFIALWYLFFGALHDWIKSRSFLSFLHSYSVLLPLLIIVTIAWSVWVHRYAAIRVKMFLYLNVLLLIYCMVDITLLLNRSLTHKKIFIAPIAFDPGKVRSKPNIYYLLFDEYPGYKGLKDSFAFGNDSLYHFFQVNGFRMLPTFSNYDYTPFSMSSILNMQYVDSNYDHGLVTQKDIQQRIAEIKDARAIAIFKKMGYAIENYSIFDIADQSSIAARNSLFPIHTRLLTDKILHNRLFRDLGWLLITGRFEIPGFRKKYLYHIDTDNHYAEQMVIESTRRKNNAPKFCYAHFLLPHGPYFRDSLGNLRIFNAPADMYNMFDKPAFLSNLKYANSVISSLVTKIVQSDSTAVIIVMSDHGFHNYTTRADYDPLNFDNICALRLPQKNYIDYKNKWSTVNFFPYLFNCAFGQQMPYLKDSTIWVNE